MNRVLLKFPLQLELRNSKTDRHLGVDIRLLRLTKAFSTMAKKPEKDIRDDALS